MDTPNERLYQHLWDYVISVLAHVSAYTSIKVFSVKIFLTKIDNFRWSQWRTIRPNGGITVSVYMGLVFFIPPNLGLRYVFVAAVLQSVSY